MNRIIKIFKSKLFFLIISLFIIGFFVGYTYAVVTSTNTGTPAINQAEK